LSAFNLCFFLFFVLTPQLCLPQLCLFVSIKQVQQYLPCATPSWLQATSKDASGLVTSMDIALNLAGDVKKTKWKLTWLAQVTFTAEEGGGCMCNAAGNYDTTEKNATFAVSYVWEAMPACNEYTASSCHLGKRGF
jgi:hypothetical protein